MVTPTHKQLIHTIKPEFTPLTGGN